jgi:hypothetical protein
VQAEFSEMPRNSIATEKADEVQAIEAIPAKIPEYKKQPWHYTDFNKCKGQHENQQHALQEIFI